ncbi:hypothetical protein A3K73_01220 [Candidatus Pacearchaeota archaeon RBG_13_36_9]|nr:MAG: hypothetical protein A3K73_01220 [Candidatus Pacearchaeota archaeon RBG_13_36_9]
MVNIKYDWDLLEKIIVEQRSSLISAKFEDDKCWCSRENWEKHLEELTSDFDCAFTDSCKRKWRLAHAYLLISAQMKYPYPANRSTETPEMRLYGAVVGFNYNYLIKEIDENKYLQDLGLDGSIWLKQSCTLDEKGRFVDSPFSIRAEADLFKKNLYTLVLAEEVKKRHEGIILDEKKVFEKELIFVVENLSELSQLDQLIAASLDFSKSHAHPEIQTLVKKHRKEEKLTKDRIRQIIGSSS